MSLTHLDELIKKGIESGAEITVFAPASSEKILAAESMLKIVFPSSYKNFLMKYGAIEIGTCPFSGLVSDDVGNNGDVVSFTKYARENYGLPTRYIAINFEDEDAFLCIDTEQKNIEDESPIVLVKPTNGKQIGGVVASTLPDYLVEYLTGYLSDD